jgi:hypothetical protein
VNLPTVDLQAAVADGYKDAAVEEVEAVEEVLWKTKGNRTKDVFHVPTVATICN